MRADSEMLPSSVADVNPSFLLPVLAAFLPPSLVVSPCLKATKCVAHRPTGRYQWQPRAPRRDARGKFQPVRSAADDGDPGEDGETPGELPEKSEDSAPTEAIEDGATVGELPENSEESAPAEAIEGRAAVEVGDTKARSNLKAQLIRKVATLNRGFVAQERDRVEIEEIVEMLELENPFPKPCEGFELGTSPIAGYWRLLYTTSLDVLSLQVNPAVTVGQIFQTIELDGGNIKNIIELQPPFAAVSNRILGNSLATLTVKLESEPVSDTRIDLKFVRTEIKANSIFGQELDLPALGVDIPSGEKLQNILEKGQARIRDAKKRATRAADDLKRRRSKDTASKQDSEGAEGDADELVTPDTSSTSSSSILKPYFETTYVDDDLRIGRTSSGDLYVSARS